MDPQPHQEQFQTLLKVPALIFLPAGRRFYHSVFFSDNTQENGAQQTNKEVISNLIKLTELQQKRPFYPSSTYQYVPTGSLLSLPTSPILIALIACRQGLYFIETEPKDIH